VRICLMVEGQEDVSWEQWRALASACEQHGVEALFRSDHYLSVEREAARGSLDALATLSALAAVTSTLRLGTLVSPVTFRHPSVFAKSVVTADHVSGGRIEAGLGAGWHEAEHEAFGFGFPPTGTRMELLEEQVEVVCRQWQEDRFSFAGRHYRLADVEALPKPVQRPRPPLILGGQAGPRSARLAARWADEYNTVYATPEECRERRGRIAHACERQGREPIPFSVMTGFVLGADRAEVLDRARRLAARRGHDADAEEFLAGLPESWVVGTVAEAVERLREFEEAGVDRVMLQHLLHEDLDAVALIGRELAPHLA